MKRRFHALFTEKSHTRISNRKVPRTLSLHAMKANRKLFLLLLLFPFLSAFAQHEQIRFTTLSVRDGLSSNSVNAMLQDRTGLMWFATEDGLDKFDGTNMTIYRHRPGDSLSLPVNEIRALHEDRAGNLWIGTAGGSVCLYNRRSNNFTAINHKLPVDLSYVRSISSDSSGVLWVGCYNGLFTLNPKTHKLRRLPMLTDGGGSSAPTVINALLCDSKQRMWVATIDGLFLYDAKTTRFKRFGNAPENPRSLQGNLVRAVVEDAKGNIWVGSEHGVSKLLSIRGDFQNFTLPPPQGYAPGSTVLHCLATERDGTIWVGTNNGLQLLDAATGQINILLPDPRSSYSISGNSIRSIYMDRQGISWVATHVSGLSKYDRNINLFDWKPSNPFDPVGLERSVVTSFAEGSHGELYVGVDGGRLHVFNRNTGIFRHVELLREKHHVGERLAILALERSRNDLIYAGSFGQGLFIYDPASGRTRRMQKGPGVAQLNSEEIICLKEDRNGFLWVGTNGGGINIVGRDGKVITRYCENPSRVNDRHYPLNNYVRVMEEDRDGNMWVGSEGAGMARFDANKGTFTVFNRHNSGLPGDVIVAILADSQNRIWVATLGGGLSVFDKRKRRFVTLTEKNGLQASSIFKLVEDKNRRIWMSTTHGISCYDVRKKRFANFSVAQGIQNDVFVRNSGIRTARGDIFFGGASGLNYFTPNQFSRNTHAPVVIFTELRVSNKVIEPSIDGPLSENISQAKEINLDYGQDFALSYVGVSFTASSQNQYRYKLQGFDKDWVLAGTSKTASYTNLDPGTYFLHVRASNNDGVWSKKETTIKIKIRPPFWRTWAAYLLYAAFVGGVLVIVRHRAIRKLEARFATEQQRKHAEQLRALDEQKIRFLTNLSHEFRTPISLILGPIDQLLSYAGEAKMQEKLRLIKRNSHRLLNLVNQLLDFRKMEEQELNLNVAAGDLVGFVADLTYSFIDLAERKDIDLNFTSSVNALRVLFDQEKVERIVFNILSNAFKFTPDGGRIAVDLDVRPYGEPATLVDATISIRDSGIGIPKEQSEKIFERFFQSDAGESIRKQGTGIGLSITQEFVRLHGGQIQVESEPGKGACFVVTLPLEIASAEDKGITGDVNPPIAYPANAPANDSNAEPSAYKVSGRTTSEEAVVLIVEDDDDFRGYLRECLQDRFQLLEARNGKDGWHQILSHHPQLVISDFSMPEMDGPALIFKIKSDKRTAHIPVILLTALTDAKSQKIGLESGANDYIAKPFDREVLIVKANNLLHLNQALKEVYSKRIELVPAELEVHSEDEKLLRRVREYVERNLTDTELSVEDISSHVAMSRGKLYYKILQITGQTPIELVRTIKLEKAVQLLERSDMNVAEIAYAAGFSTSSYFAKTFKSVYKILPSEYISLHRKK